ncbi:hypothetical protein F2981_07035 [Sinorhizobium meliloti]|nr:hypothetical protein [Sinorhizobium meliloti]
MWEIPGVYVTAAVLRRAHAQVPTYQETNDGADRPTRRWVLVVYDPQGPLQRLLKTFFEEHDPPRACARARRRHPPTARRSTSMRGAARRGECCAQALPEGAAVGKHDREITTGNREGGPFYFAEDLSPAISRQESGRLLRIARPPASAAPIGA